MPRNERRHADIWAERLTAPARRCRRRAGREHGSALIISLARRFGTNAVADLVQALEGDEEEAYAGQMTPETAAIAADEREHAAIWDELHGRSAGATDDRRGGRRWPRRRGTGAVAPERCAPPSSAPTTAWSATCR